LLGSLSQFVIVRLAKHLVMAFSRSLMSGLLRIKLCSVSRRLFTAKGKIRSLSSRRPFAGDCRVTLRIGLKADSRWCDGIYLKP
jgi:hypothetical protein